MSDPSVFIIESLGFDEESKYCEGNVLRHMLGMCEKESQYHYIRTNQELAYVCERFEDLDYRYFHLSCHGGKTAVALTLEHVSFEDLAKSFGDAISGKRLFLSACSLANDKLATVLMEKCKPLSILGPSVKVDIDTNAIFWAALYSKMFTVDPNKMSSKRLQQTASDTAKFFGIRMRFYHRDREYKKGYRVTNFGPLS